MIREIKFRAWIKTSEIGSVVNKMVYHPSYLLLGWDFEGETDMVLMQYTGLKDKNGLGNICLFEGDILSLSCELIGNIYENENLLKDTANFVIKQLGTKDWRNSEKEAMDRGWGYSI